jgi:hypothetical protein
MITVLLETNGHPHLGRRYFPNSQSSLLLFLPPFWKPQLFFSAQSFHQILLFVLRLELS